MNENKTGNKLTGNLTLKLIALVIGFLIWLLVTNSNDPTVSMVVSNVPITIVNEDSVADIGKVVEPEGSGTVTLKVTERRSILNKLSKNGLDFYVEADLENINAMNTVPLTVTCSNGNVTWDEIDIRPSSLKVKLEDKVEQAFVVSVTTTGTPAHGHAVGSTEVLDGKTILIAGPDSLISIINQVTAPVDVTNVAKDNTITTKLKVSDRNGTDLSDAQMSLLEFKDSNGNVLNERQVSVLVRLWDLKQDIKLQVLTEGKVADGYRLRSVTTVPKTISLVGEASALEALGDKLEVKERLNVEGASDTVTQEIDLTGTLEEYENIRLPADIDPIITAEADVQIRGSFSMIIPLSDIELINKPSDMKLVFTPADEISFTVYSSSEDNISLSKEDISASIDLDTCNKEGNYEIPVNITLPEGFELSAPVTVTVNAASATEAEGTARSEISAPAPETSREQSSETETETEKESSKESSNLLGDMLGIGTAGEKAENSRH